MGTMKPDFSGEVVLVTGAAGGMGRAVAVGVAQAGAAVVMGDVRNAMERRGRNPQDVVDRLSLVGRFGTPEEIAAAALWLCSDAASFTMGHALAVDAGYLTR